MKILKRLFRFILLDIITSILLISSLVIYVIIDNNTISLTKFDIYSQKVPPPFDGYKVLVVADYHDAPYYEKVIKKAEGAKPDIICVVGDLTTRGEMYMENSLKLIKGLCKVAPTYAVTGNHEEYSNNVSALIKKFEDLGVKYLLNDKIELKKDGAGIILYGLRDSNHSDSLLEKDPYRLEDKLKITSKGLDTARFNILLAHRASQFPQISKYDFDLVLAGHLHGGVVRLPFIGGVFSNSSDDLFPKYTSGLYLLNSTKMIVSRGLDKQINKMRIFNGPELVLVTLKR